MGRQGCRPVSQLAAFPKEVLEEGSGFRGEYAFDDVDAVVEEIGIGELELGADAAEAKIAGAEDEGMDAGVDKGAGAHNAGFERDVECGLAEAVIGGLKGGGS